MPVLPRLYPHRFSRPIFPKWIMSDEFILDCIGSSSIFVKETDFPDSFKYFPEGTSELTIPFRELMLCSGLMQSPSINPMGPSAWGFLLEYFESVARRPGILRYSGHASSWDLRVKQIFSERISCGIAAWCLWNIDKVVHIADAGDFIGKSGSGAYVGKSLSSLGLYGKSGKLKPDFFCLTENNECVIVECKGSMGPPSSLTTDILKGKEQVSNVRPVGINVRKLAGQLVFATNIRGENEVPKKGADSTLNVVDPEFGANAIDIKVSADNIALTSYGKILSYSGRQDIYTSLLRGHRFSENQVKDGELRFMDKTNFIPISESANFIYGIKTEAAIELLSKPLAGLSKYSPNKSKETIEHSRQSENALFELPNGFIAIPNSEVNQDLLEPT